VNEPTAFIALLRGINVGKAKRVPMAELRAVLAVLCLAPPARRPVAQPRNWVTVLKLLALARDCYP
jgi:uncharacterized protein (DUF1697 family)